MGRIRWLYAVPVILLAAGCGRSPQHTAEALHQAVAHGSVAEVKSLIARGADLNARDATGKTPLFHGNTDIVQLLIAHGADINVQDRWGFTPLHAALRSRHGEMARLLIRRGAYVQTQSHDGETPLHAAATLGDIEIVRLLVAQGAEVRAQTRTAETPLLRAAQEGHLAIAEFLIAKGADVNAKGGEDFHSPLHAAVELGHKRLVQLLLDSGAAVDPTDRFGRTPAVRAMQKDQMGLVKTLVAAGAQINLHLAAYLGDVAATKRHIEAGGDTNLRDDLDYTALHYAARQGQAEVAELLIASGADVHATDKYGYAPLHLAIDHVEVARVLLDHSARLDAEDQAGETVLEKAVFRGDKEVVSLLLARGADIDLHTAAYIGHLDKVKGLLDSGVDVNLRLSRTDPSILEELSAIYRDTPPKQREPRGDTPLHRAVRGGHADVVEFLAASGANVEARGDVGQTPLHDAAYLGFVEVAQVLISHGADVNAIAEDHQGRGQMPLQIAAHCGHTVTVALLVAKSADVNAKDTRGRTALAHAQDKGFADVVALLGGDANDPSLAERRPYTVILHETALSASEYDAVWIPTQDDIEGLDLILKDYLTENTSIPTGTHVAREHVLANLRRYSREYGGFVTDGKRYILCNLVIAEPTETPNEERFTSRFDAWWGITRVIFDAEKRTVVRVDCT